MLEPCSVELNRCKQSEFEETSDWIGHGGALAGDHANEVQAGSWIRHRPPQIEVHRGPRRGVLGK